jgi:peptide deformylase
VVAELQSTTERVAEVHTFGKGLGIAAPQIGIDRTAAIVRPPGGDTITLLNPRIVEESAETDEQYEGCLSFFDVRGMAPRPLVMHVEHQDINGSRRSRSLSAALLDWSPTRSTIYAGSCTEIA